ncbi:2og-Fe oxygenase family protein [Amylocarpus encephaloides]|uniref:2og-Fe oxygenase family protein n=1 Tax=Amylocarpus encephaloides TaxID=45428 RepID=A0A9P7YHC9_9HELO|nr:2og-Fe oxygenase family protein [Amylocarpus encephaloides]
MPTQIPYSLAKFYIPTIDIAPYFISPGSTTSLKIINQVREAELQDDVFAASEKLFGLDMSEKLKLDKSNSVGDSGRGYEVIGNQGLQEGTLPDLKEGFYIGKEISATDPRVLNNAFLIGPNQWPPTHLIPSPPFREPMEEYYDRMLNLCFAILDILAATLPYGPDVFASFISNDPVASIRLLHYPPDTSTDDRQLGAGAHTDFGAITLLLQDETGGLQVFDSSDDEWVDLKPRRDAYVVNVGDMLQMWTGGRYKSGLHRVINKGGKDRYSVPFFFDGNIDCVLSPLDGSGGEGDALTVEGHMRERFASTFGRGRKDEVKLEA